LFAATEIMSCILVAVASCERSWKRGGGLARAGHDEADLAAREAADELLAVDQAPARLATVDG
jgi:ECF sigma factor